MSLFKKVPSVTVAELAEKLAENPVIVDVREKFEYVNGHISGSQNIPLTKLRTFHYTSPVYIICHSGARSKIATQYLHKRGYNVINVKGGLMKWNALISREK
ncbi:rhodanese-like domain-containing protein [Paenilisteria rocourtiae]|uniref:Rhodanese-related sulfurtransferase n=1 Tax=Listeria rocourtiae TaxID=647910 RepID=A0A4R6ZGF3_9LIST|nr:rhodanese-like domain-containing protein [Listeria rocourtiae]EUJ47531.1 rhodanese-like domain-containing protein [Listeria rocourtiae FSL F6-920]MBC1436492.1 rhodanese-like domain-containing protein [Listeria rocourtiae]MBC1605281.1 rhodanese-like domain-containing protein [Listeria rocourtiae]TDR50939.1 rhodanese-related sulfurtransferase [Listeria rocourtiae]